MKELIDNIYNHKNENNLKVCFFMMEFIKKRKISSLGALKKFEEDSYTFVFGKKLTDLEIIKRLYENYDANYDDYMACSIGDQEKLDRLNDEFLNTEDVDTKFISLIKIYTIIN